MRYLVGFVCVVALVALPQSASAQAGEEGATSSEPAREEGGLSPRVRKRTRQKWDPHVYEVPSSEPATEEPALQLQLDDAGVGVVPPPPRTPDGYTVEEMELRVKRAKIGFGVSGVAFFAGVMMGFVAMANWESCFLAWGECPEDPDWVAPVGWTGLTLAMGGLVGMAVSGVRLAKNKRAREWLRQTHYGTPRRAQWDLARSRLVF
jgi:hypothetical protein